MSFTVRPGRKAFVLPLTLIAACKVGPDYEVPAIPLPDEWQNAAIKGLDDGEADLQTWWRTFEDPVLDELIQRAGGGNLDLKIVASRILEARAQLGITDTDLWPTLDATGAVGKQQLSEAVYGPLGGNDFTVWQLGGQLTWELDLWGRVRRTIESADAFLGASVEDYRDTLVLLFAEVGGNYISVRTLQQRVAFAKQNVEAQRASVKLTQDLVNADIRPELDLQQATLNLARTEASVPFLEQELYNTLHRLAVLVGEHPDALYSLLDQEPVLPGVPAELRAGVPSDLLRRRPDIRSAERQLAAQTAQIGAAEALLYPQFALSGDLVFQSNTFDGMFDSDAMAYSIGLPVQFNLFNRGKLHDNITIQEQLTEQALANYEQTILSALAEVESSLVSVSQESLRKGFLSTSVDAAQRSVELVLTLYKNGLTPFQNVLDMQRSLAVQQDELASSRGQVVQNLISFYKAMGGGWGGVPADAKPEEAADGYGGAGPNPALEAAPQAAATQAAGTEKPSEGSAPSSPAPADTTAATDMAPADTTAPEPSATDPPADPPTAAEGSAEDAASDGSGSDDQDP